MAYLCRLRALERCVGRSQADPNFTTAKAELIRLRVAEKKRELVPLEYMRAVEDKAIGTVLTALAGMNKPGSVRRSSIRWRRPE